MKRMDLDLRAMLGIFFILAVGVFAIFSVGGCDSGFLLTKLDVLDNSTLDEGGTPTEIVPGDGGGDLDPGDDDFDDGYEPPPGGDDSDGDGIPDDIDYFDDRVFYLCVASYGASSAEVRLNDEIIFGTNSFDNTDWVKCRVINPLENDNTVSSGYTINGKPYADVIQIEVREWDTVNGVFFPGNFYEDTIMRTTGTPETFTGTFSIPAA